MPEPTSNANALKARSIPHMILSTGDDSSMSRPPSPMPSYLSHDARAAKRFAINGNAIITGGGGSLALVNARALLEHGLSGLALFDLDFTTSDEKVDEMSKAFPKARILRIRVDVTDAAQVDRAVESALRELGAVRILCCFAGVVGCTHAIDMTPGEWKRTLDVNTSGAFLCAQATAKQMIDLKVPGAILFVASISAHSTNYPQPQAAYNASKAALISLKSSLAAEWARYGIRVNTISPGYMDTILNEGDGLEEARRTWLERNPTGRMGNPEELAGPVVLLCSEAGSYITGADLIIDGGQLCF